MKRELARQYILFNILLIILFNILFKKIIKKNFFYCLMHWVKGLHSY